MKLIATLILIFLYSCNCLSQVRTFIIDTIKVKSEILHEERSIIIFKSIHVRPKDSVKFLYMIDGEFSNYRIQQIEKRFNDTITNLIIAGIVNTDRKRDLLYIKGADKFLDFISLELFPNIEKDYNTIFRILFGHSFGGGFTMYTMIQKPNEFNYYIASSPTPIMDLIKKESYLQIDKIIKNKVVFNFSYGSNDMGQVIKWSERLKDNLTGLQFNNFNWRFDRFEGKDHNDSDVAALINGLNNIK